MFIFQSFKNIGHFLIAVLANLKYGFPSHSFYVIGVTGTNGKTSVVKMITRILESSGYKVGMNSTIEFQIGGKKWINKTKYTTINPFSHQKFLKECQKANCDFVVVETSSHGLDQNRVWGTDYNLGVVTNITREHLDYHSNMKGYRKAKLKLFKIINRQKKEEKKGFKNGFMVINQAMDKPEEFILDPERTIGYGIEGLENFKKIKKIKKTIKATDIVLKEEGSVFKVNEEEFELELPGFFNIENALAAIAVAQILGINYEKIKLALFSIKKIPGRMESIKNKKGFKIIIDYALTPDSMEKVGKMLREKINKSKEQNPQAKFIWVFGSCGQRDRGKRPLMGEIAARYADFVIITNEDPYFEDPWQIIEEVFRGVIEGDFNKREGKNAFKIIDRRKALQRAIQMAQAGDLILITGKGAEENMKIGKKLIVWNDKRVVEELLKSGH